MRVTISSSVSSFLDLVLRFGHVLRVNQILRVDVAVILDEPTVHVVHHMLMVAMVDQMVGELLSNVIVAVAWGTVFDLNRDIAWGTIIENNVMMITVLNKAVVVSMLNNKAIVSDVLDDPLAIFKHILLVRILLYHMMDMLILMDMLDLMDMLASESNVMSLMMICEHPLSCSLVKGVGIS